MHVLVVGMNHRTAPVEIRERFAFREEELPDALRMLKETNSVLEGVILSTCNRTEVYAVVDRLYMCGTFVRGFLEKWFGVPRRDMLPYLYIYEDDMAVEHLFRVACGLDSMILGETQILGQVKDAFATAQACGATGTMFNSIFRQAVTLAKRAHTETGIAERPVSVSYAAVELGRSIVGDYGDKTVLLIGAGKMGGLTIRHLKAAGVGRLLVANRTWSRAVETAEAFGGRAVPWESVGEALAEADVVVSSTGASGHVLTAEAVRAALAGRRTDRPVLMIDIAVPRDLDPAIGDLPNVYLYDIDDLERLVDRHFEERRKQAARIEAMVREELVRYREWLRMLGVVPVIRALRGKAEAVYRSVMADLENKLPELNDRQIKTIRKLAKSIVNQLLRDPIERLKETAGEPPRQRDEALRMFVRMFALEDAVDDEVGGAPENSREEAVAGR